MEASGEERNHKRSRWGGRDGLPGLKNHVTWMMEEGLPCSETLGRWGTEPARPGLWASRRELFLEPHVIMGHFVPYLKPSLSVKSSCNLFEFLLREEVTFSRKSLMWALFAWSLHIS